MSEEDDGDIWGDDYTEGRSEEDDWERNDPFFDEPSSSIWEDSEGATHELHYGEPEIEDAEYRQGFDSFDEARDYINEILTGADQYFDIYYDADDGSYEVYYMGGSE